jgi:hypothetical protein
VGTVVDERGRGVEGVRLAVAGVEGSWAFAGTTDEDGAFGLPLVDEGPAWVAVVRGGTYEMPPPGELVEGARWTTHVPASAGEGFVVHRRGELARVEVVPGVAASARLVVAAERGRIAGVVRDAQGRTHRETSVRLIRAAHQPAPLRGHEERAATTDRDGRFEFTDLASGRYDVEAGYCEDVGLPAFACASAVERDVEPSVDLELTLAPLTRD